MTKFEKKRARAIGRHNAKVLNCKNIERLAKETIKEENASIDAIIETEWSPLISSKVVDNLAVLCEERVSWAQFDLEKAQKDLQVLESIKI